MNAESPVGGADFTAKDKLDEKQVALQITDYRLRQIGSGEVDRLLFEAEYHFQLFRSSEKSSGTIAQSFCGFGSLDSP